MSNVQVVLLEPARVMLGQIGNFLVKALAVIFILVIGWLISKLVKNLVTKLLRALKFDEISDKIGVDSFLEKGGITYSLSELIGVICYWFGILVTIMVTLTPFNLVTPNLVERFIAYVPNVISSIVILVLGMFIATILRNIVLTAANNAGVAQSKVLGKAVEVIVIAFAIFISLEQLHIGIRITELTLAIVLGALGLGLALAFGLGCKDIAGRFVGDLVDKLKRK